MTMSPGAMGSCSVRCEVERAAAEGCGDADGEVELVAGVGDDRGERDDVYAAMSRISRSSHRNGSAVEEDVDAGEDEEAYAWWAGVGPEPEVEAEPVHGLASRAGGRLPPRAKASRDGW